MRLLHIGSVGRHFLISIFLGALFATPVRAEVDQNTASAISATRAVFYHELGHAMIDVLGLPVVGPEEDVADEFAAYMMILTNQRDNRGVDSLFSAIRLFHGMARMGKTRAWGQHAPNDRRFFLMACLMHGSDPGRFYPVITELGMPHSRARGCELEYAEKRDNWISLLRPHLRSDENPQTGIVRPFYEPAASSDLRAVERLWRQTGYLEKLSSEASSLFGLPKDVNLIGRECGMANAHWSPGANAMVLCYEFMPFVAAVLSLPAQDVDSTAKEENETGQGQQNIGGSLGQGN